MFSSPLRPIDVPDWRMTGARIPVCVLAHPFAADRDGFALVDVDVEHDRIRAISQHGQTGDAQMPMVDLAGQIVLPCFVDAHVHLDKGHIWPRAPNPDGSFAGAREAVLRDRTANWTSRDVRKRMEFGLRCAYAHGTIALRTHIDSVGSQIDISWPIFAALREQWRGKIEVSASPLFPIDLALDSSHMAQIVSAVKSFGTTLGAVTYAVPALSQGLHCIFRTASENGFDLDFHVDETNDISANSLRLIAETALQYRFKGRILAGHCCALSLQSETEARQTIELVAKAGIAIVSLPMCNSYLMDRSAGRTPRWRGVTPLTELRTAGINVMLASDNTRDPFYAYGDLDMLEVLREGTRILHLDHPFADWPRAVTCNPAAAIGRPQFGRLASGGGADFIVFRARTLSELLARPQMDRCVIRDGHLLDTPVPDYVELDSDRSLRL
jgi:cytosine/creatinine deaminase